ncbi:type II toxin-antitoxin system Phd/YefM family antitoxin [Levilactobacillus lindianensis]|uniref:type II toxin-antitoxin system Phd/YefM family antitoxin n=1 Tax=Levilactobacillus lindianensis TaxID=2486018 RepID=UPI000F73C471|nr:type II toxin-antitoxin system Phd/YefM family antitoxin [Levilactobacillus lindianensis]
MDTYTPTNARKNFYGLIKDVNRQKKPIVIEPANGNEKEAAVLISKRDWDSIQETIYLENVGVMDKVREREANEEDGFEDVDHIDWDSL